MAVLSLLLCPQVNRIVTLCCRVLHAISIAVSCIGETWVYYLIGSAVEVVPSGRRRPPRVGVARTFS